MWDRGRDEDSETCSRESEKPQLEVVRWFDAVQLRRVRPDIRRLDLTTRRCVYWMVTVPDVDDKVIPGLSGILTEAMYNQHVVRAIVTSH